MCAYNTHERKLIIIFYAKYLEKKSGSEQVPVILGQNQSKNDSLTEIVNY